ncbi:hypothetical protein K7432_006968 [Basidiobolus ranarum]|uniref:RZ-type domain-containing protein n=1 Tax=Basidiobolus ranarum TaxID=34480 RepID=A0ABR2WU77_9FUNG
MHQSFREVDLNNDPILVLSCGHALTMSSMDGVMEMKDYYVGLVDENFGTTIFTSLCPLPGKEVKQMSCHICREPIAEILRYGRRIKYAQLGMRSKKYLRQQINLGRQARLALQKTESLLELKQAEFIALLSRDTAYPQDVAPQIRELRAPPCELRCIPEALFLNIADIYKLPPEHQAHWIRYIRPAVSSYRKFRKINEKACNAPSRQLFEASVSHLFRGMMLNPLDEFDNLPSQETKLASEVIDVCILECGLSADGFDGSSFIESLQEMINVLLLVDYQATRALHKVGIASGWYWFVDDLNECIHLYLDRIIVIAKEKKYDRHLAYARLAMMDVLCKKIQLLGKKPILLGARVERLALVDSLIESFWNERNQMHTDCPVGIKDDCLRKSRILEEKFYVATRIARSETFYAPVTKEEKAELFRAMSHDIRGTGHWYRCPNGHTYVIADCGMAMQTSQCPECGATIGGLNHELLTDNVYDAEFEQLAGQP